MNEEQIKFLCKWIIDHGNCPLTELEKELFKQAIDKAKNTNEIAAAIAAAFRLTEDRNF